MSNLLRCDDFGIEELRIMVDNLGHIQVHLF